MNLLGVLEGILFAVGDEGITLKGLCDVMDIDIDEAKDLLMQIQKRYESDEYGIRVSYLGDAFKLTTKKEHKDYYHKLLGSAGYHCLQSADNSCHDRRNARSCLWPNSKKTYG